MHYCDLMFNAHLFSFVAVCSLEIDVLIDLYVCSMEDLIMELKEIVNKSNLVKLSNVLCFYLESPCVNVSLMIQINHIFIISWLRRKTA